MADLLFDDVLDICVSLGYATKENFSINRDHSIEITLSDDNKYFIESYGDVKLIHKDEIIPLGHYSADNILNLILFCMGK